MDLTWEERKARTRDLSDCKRRRHSKLGEEGSDPPKRGKRIKYAIMEEHWGEESETDPGAISMEQETTSLDELAEKDGAHNKVEDKECMRYKEKTRLAPQS